jgi:hypothetical protein
MVELALLVHMPENADTRKPDMGTQPVGTRGENSSSRAIAR